MAGLGIDTTGNGNGDTIPDKGFTAATVPMVKAARFGDGYEQRKIMGINTIKQTFNVSFNNRTNDEIDDIDRLFLVDAIVNPDNPHFNMKLLRTLVKEYYTSRIENVWWKGMGYPEGKIDVMRLKINTLTKARFKKEKAEAAQNGMLKFKFDGKVYPTGMTKAKVKKQEEERGKAAEKAQAQTPPITPGLNQ